MKRRDFLRASAAAVAASGVSAAWAAPPKRPNILYIMTDQQFSGAMSSAGCRDVKTPAMDSLAGTGVRFENAYCAQPLCVPSRTAMFTGRMPHELDANTNNTKIDIGPVPTLGQLLAGAGYDCAYYGKWHLPLDTKDAARHGFATFAKGENAKDARIPAGCEEFLGRTRKEPFFLVASFINPHNICQFARGEPLPDGPIGDPPPPEKCPALPANFEIPAGEPNAVREAQRGSVFVYPTVGWAPERWRQYRWAYYRMIEKVDGLIGQVLEALRRSGQYKNTLIVFSADHGDGHGSHRWNQKSCLYEEVVRVPFVVSLPAVTKAGLVDREHLVSSGLDLLPTICDYAAVEPPRLVRGRSVRPIAEGRQRAPWRDEVFSETVFDKVSGFTGRTVRTARYKYIVYSPGQRREQLFDLQNDPGEKVSLVDDPAHRIALDEHRRRLAAWCRETNDSFDLI